MTGEPAPDSGRFRAVLLGVLAVVLALGVVASLALGVVRASGVLGDPDEVQRDREAVMAQARQFMLRLNTYGPDLLEGEQMPDYRETVGSIMTPKFRSSFEEGVVAAEQTVAEAGVARTAEVFAAGVSDLDGSKATALVAGSFTSSYPRNAKKPDGPRVEDQPVPFRVEVDLVLTDGTWLVDDFSPVLADEGTSGGTPAVPSAPSTSAPSTSAPGSGAPSEGSTP